METIGWIGAILLAFCCLPQAIKTWRTKSVDDLSFIMLWMWAVGEVMTFSYIIWTNINIGEWQMPLMINYGLNTVIIIYLLYAKHTYKTTSLERMPK